MTILESRTPQGVPGSGLPRVSRTPPRGALVPLLGFAGGQELLIIALVILVLFGGTKIPALMRGMGQGIREFRKELKPGDDDNEENGGSKEQH